MCTRRNLGYELIIPVVDMIVINEMKYMIEFNSNFSYLVQFYSKISILFLFLEVSVVPWVLKDLVMLHVAVRNGTNVPDSTSDFQILFRSSSQNSAPMYRVFTR